ncbi:nuclear transport factor 2 family protein [Nocardia xishanensis]|uniref:nuclear transport factor 2 family protein n=1 Tax=Nocardia xishanensis TaxID=238964 RepID=UPI000836BCDC|nr:nuclear transport factor 2 family protein [Nocardia xishanensis]
MPTTDHVTAFQLALRWTEFWNGAMESAPKLLSPDFRIRFASPTGEITDALRGPDDVAAFIGEFRAARPGLRFTMDGDAAGEVDAAGSGTFAIRWRSHQPDQPDHSGIDMFEATAGKLTRVWSVTGTSTFAVD